VKNVMSNRGPALNLLFGNWGGERLRGVHDRAIASERTYSA
jgi:hypothetical protein